MKINIGIFVKRIIFKIVKTYFVVGSFSILEINNSLSF